MKNLLILFFLFAGNLICFGQKQEFLKGIEFDSSYCIIGLGQGFQRLNDSLPRFWFILDNPKDMEALRKDWVLNNGSIRTLEANTIEIYVTKDNQRINGGALIYPRQGSINVLDHWYKFDTAKLTELHKEHPLRYHSEHRIFDTFHQYVAYANSILHDSLLLFFFEPSRDYEGKFTVTVKGINNSDNAVFAARDINKELGALAPRETFSASPIVNDSFNVAHPDKVRITVYSTKSLYDRYRNKSYEIGEWQPTLIDMKIFWRD